MFQVIEKAYKCSIIVCRMSKRRRDGPVVVHSLKRRLDVDHDPQNKRARAVPSLKRSYDEFDGEVAQMRKRLRTAPPRPTPEAAMAFLLPHLLKLRQLYIDAAHRVETLEAHNAALARGYNAAADENARLRAQLEQARYRLQLCMPVRSLA